MNSYNDSIKSKALGQFFTPDNIASFMAKWVCYKNPKTILDPGLGHCILLDYCHLYSKQSILYGYDIDESIPDYVKENVNYKIDLKLEDYLMRWGDKYDGIICNPPYNKFQTIKNRNELISIFEDKIGIKLSGYTNILGYFLVKSISELNKGGRSAYIIPYEFLNTGYGSVIKKYLLDEKILTSIIKFDNSKNVFDDAVTTTCILLMEKNAHDSVSFINIKDAIDLETIDFSTIMSQGKNRKYSSLDSTEKWLKYFDDDDKQPVIQDNLTSLSKIGKVMRGIATGDNDYFSLSKSKIVKHGISDSCLIPCICKSSDITELVITKDYFETLVEKDKKTFLFNGCNVQTDEDRKYIEYGIEKGTHMKYLTSHRKPWYLIENKKNAPILITVFNRDGLKVVRNEAQVSNLTTFHGLHLNKKYDNELDANVIFCYLCSDVAKDIISANKREYGDKLDKFEPNDLNQSLVVDPDCISDDDKYEIHAIYNGYKKNKDKESFVILLNNIFEKYVKITP